MDFARLPLGSRCSDINSIALTTLTSLLRKFAIDPSTIGRLEVGTETVLDKSKSCKSVLMQIFEAAGYTDIEGIDNLNACYGGTNALINSVNWIHSPSWDGRNAIVVAGDIALYDQPNARPTGGVGCIAMLIGPHAPLVMEPVRGTCIKHVYDFYKPNFKTEYPHVDGQLSIRYYLDSLEASYDGYLKKSAESKKSAHSPSVVSWALEDWANISNSISPSTPQATLPLDKFDFMVFHSPTCKLVTKAYARLLYLSYLSNPNDKVFASITTSERAYLANLSHDASLTDKILEKRFLTLSKSRFQNRVQPSMLLPNMCGNMYCASVWGALLSLLCGVEDPVNLIGKRVGVYSYGGGLAATFLSIRVSGDVGEIVKKTNLQERLDARAKVSVMDYLEVGCSSKTLFTCHVVNFYNLPVGTDTDMSVGYL